MPESSKPKFAVVVEFETVAAHYYGVAGLGTLYLTAEDEVNANVSQARTYSTKANAARAGQRAMKSYWGIKTVFAEQVGAEAESTV